MIRTAWVFGVLAACSGGEEPLICDTLLRASTSVTVLDPSGDEVTGAIVTCRANGGDVLEGEEPTHGTYVCGWDGVSGDFEVTVWAMGYAVDTFEMTVGHDACGVITERVERTLEPVACTDEEVPGALLTVTDAQGADVVEATVSWGIPLAELAPATRSRCPSTWCCPISRTDQTSRSSTASWAS